MTKPEKAACYYCQRLIDRRDLRPCGSNAALVCYPCVTSDPERNATADAEICRQMQGAIKAATVHGNIAVILLGENGPAPLGSGPKQ